MQQRKLYPKYLTLSDKFLTSHISHLISHILHLFYHMKKYLSDMHNLAYRTF
jgi:hypothetical protein